MQLTVVTVPHKEDSMSHLWPVLMSDVYGPQSASVKLHPSCDFHSKAAFGPVI